MYLLLTRNRFVLKTTTTLKKYKAGNTENSSPPPPPLSQLSSLLRGYGIFISYPTEAFYAYTSKRIFPSFTHMVYLALYSNLITFIRNNSTARKWTDLVLFYCNMGVPFMEVPTFLTITSLPFRPWLVLCYCKQCCSEQPFTCVLLYKCEYF